MSSVPTVLELVKTSFGSSLSLLPLFAKPDMPVESKLRGDAVSTTPALSDVGEEGLGVCPMIVCLDGIAHILHPRLMKFHCSLQLRGLPEYAIKLGIEKGGEHVVKRVNQGGLSIHRHGYTRGWPLFSWLGLPLEKGFEDFYVVLKGVANGFQWPSLSCLRLFQVAMERGDHRLDLLQVERVLGLLDLCDVEQLSREESNRVWDSTPPSDPSELFLCLLQDNELLGLGPWITNHTHPGVPHLDLTRCDSKHGLCKGGV